MCGTRDVDNNLTLGYRQTGVKRNKSRASEAASLMGRRSAAERMKRWGKEGFRRRMQEWGKLGGRPAKAKGNKKGKE